MSSGLLAIRSAARVMRGAREIPGIVAGHSGACLGMAGGGGGARRSSPPAPSWRPPGGPVRAHGA